jgi:hypothetical protein
MLDYIIIGSGLASSAFVEKALENQKKILVFSDFSQLSSMVAGGLYNPVILKRFTPTYEAKKQTLKMYAFYKKVEKKYNDKFIFKNYIYRKFSNIEEQNNWFFASDKLLLKEFLDAKVHQIDNNFLLSNYGFGKVNDSGWVDVKKYLANFENYLLAHQLLLKEKFDYQEIKKEDDYWLYQTYKTRNIVFCEGYGVLNNPYFKQLPMIGTKGELITIKAEKLKLDKLIKSNIFIIPLENDLYKIGATYEWDDKTKSPTEKGKLELIEEIKKTINCPFDIIDHQAEIRPTTKDRKPFVGEHPLYKNLYILNGLGTRGVVQAPDLADDLYTFIENGTPLPIEIDIKRLRKIDWQSID